MPTPTLWSANRPEHFWLCDLELPPDIWQTAAHRAAPLLQLDVEELDIDTLLEYSLGERQFGQDRYQLSFARRTYYALKPLLNQKITHAMRKVHSGRAKKASGLSWPIETRYVKFLRETLRQVMFLAEMKCIRFRYFWPAGRRYAFVITHDIETADGQRAVPILADLEESLGFRSSFNFVPERYPLDKGLMDDLRVRGFEIGVHGLHHDSHLFTSHKVFEKQVTIINRYIDTFGADGFRSPYTHRNPDWMQSLRIKYDSSFFDSDPFEPMPGGVMTIWPYTIGRFLELPYTLPQDCTMFNVLGMQSNQLWRDKIAFVREHGGMALLLVHPDYSSSGVAYESYADLLKEMQDREDYWHTCPRNVADWWTARSGRGTSMHQITMAEATLAGNDIHIEIDTFESNKATQTGDSNKRL